MATPELTIADAVITLDHASGWITCARASQTISWRVAVSWQWEENEWRCIDIATLIAGMLGHVGVRMDIVECRRLRLEIQRIGRQLNWPI